MKTLTITIPEPCSENFDKMTPVKGGKFCGLCEKTIVDFRTMSDRQIINHYKKNGGKVCGIFREGQLNRTIPFPMEVQPNRNWKAVAALAVGLMFSGGLNGQSAALKIDNSVVLEKTIGKRKDKGELNQEPSKILKGTISDVNDVLIGANVRIKGTNIGIATDLDGNFDLKIPGNLTSLEIEISYVGFETQTLFFNKQLPISDNRIEITLKERLVSIDEIEVVGLSIQENCVLMGTGIWVSNIVIDATESDIIEKEKVTVLPEVKAFPNPFFANLNVSFDYNTAGDYLFHIYDMNGRLLFAKTYNLLKGKQTVELDLANQRLVDEMYILQVSDKKDRILATKKVVKGG